MPAARLPARRAEFEHGDLSARPANARHLGQAAVGVGHVPQAERDRDDRKPIVLKRQVLGVGLDKRQFPADLRPRLFAAADLQHLAAKVGRDDLRLAPVARWKASARSPVPVQTSRIGSPGTGASLRTVHHRQ